MTSPKINDEINKLDRKDQSTIFRLRTQHIPLNKHLNRIGAIAETACPLCNHPEETVEHHLFYCPQLLDLRKQLLPPQPDIHNTLFSNHRQLKNTCTYHHMSLSRWFAKKKCNNFRLVGPIYNLQPWLGLRQLCYCVTGTALGFFYSLIDLRLFSRSKISPQKLQPDNFFLLALPKITL